MYIRPVSIQGYLSPKQVSGHVVPLLQSNELHMEGSKVEPRPETPSGSFGKALFRAFGQVSDRQVNSAALAQRMITEPASVNVHDVTIAMAEANLSLSMSKAIADGAIKAYREIVSIR